VFKSLRRMTVLIVCSLSVTPSWAAVDPTRPPALQQRGEVSMGVKKANPWQLQGIRISAQGRYAVINDTQVRQGERIRGAEVLAIEPGSVVLKQGSRRISLTLGSLINIKRNSQEAE
jgi:hypothetical protein